MQAAVLPEKEPAPRARSATAVKRLRCAGARAGCKRSRLNRGTLPAALGRMVTRGAAAIGAVDAGRLWRGARGLGPYVLVELLLPGGTLIALMLWLAQQARAGRSAAPAPRDPIAPVEPKR